MRLDKYLSETFSMTRNRAQFCIDSGLVLVNGKTISKASYETKEADSVEMLEDKKSSFVARSAVKLDSFLESEKMDVTGYICLDVGASTGGFTQVLLQRGAQKVVALDVGTSQLHESLRSDPRVISRENTDIREAGFEEVFDMIVVDVSFISLRKIVPSLIRIMGGPHPQAPLPGGEGRIQLILLFKPQFEVGKENLRKTGVPKDEKITKRALDDFLMFCRGLGLGIHTVLPSALPGEAGNQEWVILCS